MTYTHLMVALTIQNRESQGERWWDDVYSELADHLHCHCLSTPPMSLYIAAR